MVTCRRGLVGAIILFTLGAGSAAKADGVLDQMQAEVAAIVRANKGAIVSIEDEGAMPPRRAERGEGAPRIAAENAVSERLVVLRARQRPGTAAPGAVRVVRFEPGGRHHPAGSRADDEVRKESFALARLPQERRGSNPFDRMNAPKSGTGFSIGNGYVVTTADVVEGMQRPVIVTEDGTGMRARLVGIDRDRNLGVLQLPPGAILPAVKMGDSSRVAPGHFAIAIGNQSGHANSVALTMVSGVREEGTFTGDRFYPALIQIAGTIGAGASGAPVFNSHGEVIGVIAGVPAGEWTESQIYSDAPLGGAPGLPGGPSGAHPPGPQPEPRSQSGFGRGKPFGFGPGPSGGSAPNAAAGLRVFLRPPTTGTAFAIPINDLQSSIHELVTNGRIVPTWVGVDLRPDRKVEETGDVIRVKRSIRIRGVYPDSPAQRGGLMAGDTLTALNGSAVHSMAEVRAAFLRLHPGDHLDVTVDRGGKIQQMRLIIDARPDKIVPPTNQSRRHPQ